jgi:hypothetical protein
MLSAFLQDACGTCDADCSLVCKALQQAGLNPATTQVLVLHPKTLAEVLDSIVTVGHAAGAVGAARRLVQQLQQRLMRVAARVAAACPAAAAAVTARSTATAYMLAEEVDACRVDECSSSSGEGGGEPAAVTNHPGCTNCQPVQQQQQRWQQPPRVLSLEGLNPLVLGGQWLPDVKAAVGAVDASGQQPGDSPARITWQQVSPA